MQEAIRSIIGDIPSGCMFDAHFVINKLIKSHSDAYFSFARSVDTTSLIANRLHGLISIEIARNDPDLILRQGDAWSETIHGDDRRCACWEKK